MIRATRRPQTRRALEAAARKNRWSFVDKHLGSICTKRNITYAFTRGTLSPSENVRDFHYSLIEKANLSEADFAPMRKPIFTRLIRDTGRYSRFRAACALVKHGPGAHKAQVFEIIKEYRNDPDVKDIARTYLRKLRG
jgi:hypothetical protein